MTLTIAGEPFGALPADQQAQTIRHALRDMVRFFFELLPAERGWLFKRLPLVRPARAEALDPDERQHVMAEAMPILRLRAGWAA